MSTENLSRRALVAGAASVGAFVTGCSYGQAGGR